MGLHTLHYSKAVRTIKIIIFAALLGIISFIIWQFTLSEPATNQPAASTSTESLETDEDLAALGLSAEGPFKTVDIDLEPIDLS